MNTIKKIVAAVVAILLAVTILIPFTTDLGSESRLEVMVISGQSNSAYRNVNLDVVNENVPLPTTNVYYYGTENAPIYYGGMPPYGQPTYDTSFSSYGIHSMVSNGAWKIGSYEPSLAQAISKKTNCDVLIINAGISAASIDYLQPGNTGGEYVNEVISRALALVEGNYNKIDKIGYCWMQGETDKTTPVADYIEKFETVNNWYHQNGFDICYMVKTKDVNGGNACIAQMQIAQDDPSVIMASTAPDTFTVANGLLDTDNLHYSQAGRIVVANDIDGKLNLKTYISDNAVVNLITIIPIVVIAGIVIATVGAFIVYRNDP